MYIEKVANVYVDFVKIINKTSSLFLAICLTTNAFKRLKILVFVKF